MYCCKKCEKKYEKRHAYIAHCRVHSGYQRPKKEKKEKLVCIYCKSVFENGRQLGAHMTHCTSNPKHLDIIKNMSKAGINKNFHWSEKDKKRISEERIKYLTEHPDKVPYKLNHSSKMSYPELIFKNALESVKITGWTYNYQNGIYSYDFAFPELKIDVEIDGGTHSQEQVKKIDERRDKFSNENGWQVIRFTAKNVKENVLKCINQINLIQSIYIPK
jgi:very-short-patch-repair endonuclease